MPKTSAGILMYRRSRNSVEVFLVHPGGPFWAKKDVGSWSIPKGEYEPDEDPLAAARREFKEETGFDVDGDFIPLDPIKQRSGKIVSAWMVEGSADATAIRSNKFWVEWPPKSGRQAEFPEVDRADWFDTAAARLKLIPGQVPFIDSLCAYLEVDVTSVADDAPMHDIRAIARAILDGYTLPVRGYHGVVHWARVLENGLRIAELNGGDREVVTLFALFHDSRRVNEQRDNGHGLRGAELARSFRGTLVHLDDSGFDLLFEACRLHTDGLISEDATLQACWDADRLDLGRVGITPRSDRLCSDAARGLLEWANERAVSRYEPTDVLSAWGVLTDAQSQAG